MEKDDVRLTLPYHLQFFADGGMGALDGLLNGMSTADDASSTTEIDEPETPEENNEPEETPETPPVKPQAKPQDKQGYAFAQMRSQNAQLFGLLSKMAQATGLDFKDNNDLIAKLNDDAIVKLAQKQNVPPELLRKLDALEQDSKAYKAEQLKGAAFIGFQKVKSEYGLSEEELRTFAQALDGQGKNPFVTPMDVMAEYKLLHFDDIVENKVKAAVEAALKKSNAADEHSSVPNSAQGKPDSGEGDKVSTIAGLNEMLKGFGK
jgi:hypothetical protein